MRKKSVLWEIYQGLSLNRTIEYHFLYLWFVFMILIFILCSCQKKPKAIIYMTDSVVYNSDDNFQVKGNDYQKTLDYCLERLEQLEENSVEAADIYSEMGGIYSEYLEDKDNALFYLNKAVEIHQRNMEEIRIARDYSKMSMIYIYIEENNAKGLDYLEKAESIYCKYGLEDSFGLAGVLINRGHLYMNGNQYENALIELNRAQEIYDKRKDVNETIHILKGKVYLELLEYKLAEEQYFIALEISQKKGDEYSVANVNFELGWLYRNAIEYNKAIERYQLALDFYNTNEIYLTDKAVTYNNLAYAYNLNKNLEDAMVASIAACRTIEKVKPSTSKIIKKKENYKHNLGVYWIKWYESESKAEFENWYTEIVLEEKEWNDGHSI